MKTLRNCLVLLLAGLIFGASPEAFAEGKKILIVVEGATTLKNYAMGDGRQLAALLGHFQTSTKVIGVREYQRGELQRNDFVFYVGFHASNPVPAVFTDDVLQSTVPVIWLNTGFREFSRRPEVKANLGFIVSRFDSTSMFTSVKAGDRVFQKGEPNLNIIEIADRKKVEVLATASSEKGRHDVPYIVHSGNLLYVADSPFASATETDRYLLFADMLHDILHEQHDTSHTALIRIEDVNPMDDPGKLREIADILSSRGVPFLVSVIPFYVDPGQGIRSSLSDKPDLVDALKYMVQNGGTIVMHGVTHQYKGVTASDYEFWDESTNKPIKDETVEGIQRKLDMGIQEFMRNGLYPLIWETPHYAASFRLYQTVARYFSTAMEQRLAIEDFDYSQFFPYVIQRDLFGQRIYPENLGYVPLDSDKEKSRGYVRSLIEKAKGNLVVRDGFASCFFHSFLDLDLLVELVEGMEALGYEYMDVREQCHWVKTRDRVILTGSQSYTLTLDDQYLSESWYQRDGSLRETKTSEARIRGPVTRDVTLAPGEFYKAEPTELRERKQNMVESVMRGAQSLVRRVLGTEEQWREARPAILWNHFARGAAYNDQASFAAAIRSINIAVDTIYVGEQIDLSRNNLVIVPYAFVDSLGEKDFDLLTKFVEDGGNLITDGKNDLAENFGIRFSTTRIRVNRVRDRLFPDERIRWAASELVNKFDVEDIDRVFCLDEVTEAPLVIGKTSGKGKVLYFGTRFDPLSQLGTSYYPYLLEYIRSYFLLGPILRRDNLEVYFDPGYRRNISTESLIKQWVRQGIRVLHVAGWHQYPKYTYDYERLVRLAHANGIMVYAWLEPPQVSQKFWKEHPEWREKNYRGEDVSASWRIPMAMTDPHCLEAMVGEYRTLLEKYDWDGVNLAELYFEAGRGFKDATRFTPMHASARQEFKRQYGFDPAAIFDQGSEYFWKTNHAAAASVVEYRVRTLERISRSMLDMMVDVAKKKEGFEIIVTAMDSFGSPELREYLGVDMSRILAQQKQYGFLLQVEDPEHLWSTDPRRYIAMGERYAALLGDRGKLLLDLNILSFRKPDIITPFPTVIQTGTESFQLVQAAALGAPRLTIYAESSINPQDMMFLPYALSADVRYRHLENGYAITSPYAVVLKLPPGTKEIRVDGSLLTPSRENLFLIPAGEHFINMQSDPTGAFTAHTLDARVLSLTGNLLSVTYGMRSIAALYEAKTRALMSINREPTAIRVDDQEYAFSAMKGNDCYTFFLPPGRHQVEIVAGDVFSYGVNLTSLWSTNAIALFGFLAVLALLLMYTGVRIVRRRSVPAGGNL
jgi:uncharacterized protein YdaL